MSEIDYTGILEQLRDRSNNKNIVGTKSMPISDEDVVLAMKEVRGASSLDNYRTADNHVLVLARAVEQAQKDIEVLQSRQPDTRISKNWRLVILAYVAAGCIEHFLPWTHAYQALVLCTAAPFLVHTYFAYRLRKRELELKYAPPPKNPHLVAAETMFAAVQSGYSGAMEKAL